MRGVKSIDDEEEGPGATNYRESYEQFQASSQLLGRATMERAVMGESTLQRGSCSSSG
jgi:hypothetical protein